MVLGAVPVQGPGKLLECCQLSAVGTLVTLHHCPVVLSTAPLVFSVKDPSAFCWWLLTHLAPLYWYNEQGVFTQRKKVGSSNKEVCTRTDLKHGHLPRVVALREQGICTTLRNRLGHSLVFV